MAAVLEVRPVRAADQAHVGRMLASAFADHTNYGAIFPGTTAYRTRALAWFFARRLLVARVLGCVTLGLWDTATGECVATLTLGTIRAHTPPLWVQLWSGLLLWPFLWGFASLRAALALGRIHSDATHATHGACDLELMMVATAPECQGKGYGTRLLKHALGTLPEGVTVGLTTQRDTTKAWYERVGGFEVTSHPTMRMPGTGHEYPCWTMRLTAAMAKDKAA